MAKIIEQMIIIKLSKLVKDSETDQSNLLMDAATIASLDEVIQSLVDTSTVAEIIVE